MANLHRLSMENREKLVITDVKDVYSFDDHIINLFLGENDLTVSGDELSITKLSLDPPDGGEVIINGKIEAIVYSDSGRNNTKKTGRFSKLFK